MLNDTGGVSIQPATLMNKNGESNNDVNTPSNVSISIDTNRQSTFRLKNKIPTSLMDLEDTEHHTPSITLAKKRKNRPPLLKHIHKKKARPPFLKQLLTEDEPIITLASLAPIPSTTKQPPTYKWECNITKITPIDSQENDDTLNEEYGSKDWNLISNYTRNKTMRALIDGGANGGRDLIFLLQKLNFQF